MSTTVFVTDGDDAAAACAVLGSWVEAGLCRPFLVVRASDVDGNSRAQQQAVIHQGTGEKVVELFPHLGQVWTDRVRFIALHVLGDSDEAHANPVAIVEAARLLGDDARRQLGVGQTFVALNLFVPAKGVTGVPEDVLRPDWNLNIVAAAEDRVDPAHSGMSVEGRRLDGSTDPRFITHASFACAAAGQLWLQMRSGPFDEVIGSSGQALVVVTRSFVRMLEGTDPVGRILETALRPNRAPDHTIRWPVPSAPDFVEATKPGPYLAAALRETLRLRDGAFDLKAGPSIPKQSKRVVSNMEILREFVRFILARLRQLPVELKDQVSANAIRRVNALTTRLTVGEDSNILVRFGGRRTAEDLIPLNLAVGDLAGGSVELAALLDDADTYLPPAYEEVWSGVRSACFGLADGAPMPEGYSTPSLAAKRPAIVDPWCLAPDPFVEPLAVDRAAAGLPGNGLLSLGPFDPFATDAVLRRLQELSDAGADDPGRDAAMAQVIKWRDERKSALLWRAGSHLGEQVEVARTQVLAALETVAKGPPRSEDKDQLAAAGKKVWRRTVMSLAVALVLCVVAVVGARVFGLGALVVAVIPVVIAVGWFLSALHRFSRHYRWEFQLRHRHRTRVTQFEQAVEDAAHYGRELVRLGSLYWQYQRWAEIVAHLLHRPWGEPLAPPEPAAPLRVVDPPYAFRVATAELDQEKLVPLASKVRAGVYRTGWIGLAYREVEQHVMNRMREEGALGAAPKPLDDQPQASNGALDELVGALRSAQHGAVTMATRTSEAVHEVEEREPSSLFGAVRLGDDSDTVQAGEDAANRFLTALFPGEAAPPLGSFNNEQWSDGGMDASPIVARSIILGPGPLQAPPAVGVEPSVVATIRRPGRLLYSSIRIDSAERCEGSHLELFAKSGTRHMPGQNGYRHEDENEDHD